MQPEPLVGEPLTVSALHAAFVAAGVQAGMILLVHSSLRSLGRWVVGGPAAVVLALEEALGPDGTLVMPTQTGDLSDPAGWRSPPVAERWWEVIRTQMPAYTPDLTPTRSMGTIPECFRKQAGTLRSPHPQVSFAARGLLAQSIVAAHPLENGLGETSPLARLYDAGAYVLLLGVGHDKNTSLHLAEYRATWPGKHVKRQGAPVLVDGQRQWVIFPDLDLDSSDFPVIGAAFETATALARRATIGVAQVLLFPQRPLVDFAVHWMETHRQGG